RVIGGRFAEHVEEFLREKVRVRVDAHGCCSRTTSFVSTRRRNGGTYWRRLLSVRQAHCRTDKSCHVLKRASTAGGIGCDFMRAGSCGSRTTHTRVSKPSTASVPALVMR